MKRIKIMYLGPSLSLTGSTRVMLDVLNNLDRARFKSSVVLHSPDRMGVGELIKEDVEILDFQEQVRWYTRSLIRRIQFAFFLRGLLLQHQPDCIIVDMRRYIYDTLYLTHFLRLNIPVICRWGAVISPLLGKFAYAEKFRIKHLLPLANKIIVPSSLAKQDLVNEFAISDQKILIIPNVIDEEKIRYSAETEKVATQNEKVILFVGALSERKDPFTLLRAFELLQRDGNDTALWFVGDGELKEKLKAYAAERCGGSVRFWGHQRNPYKFMKAADILVHCSRADGFAITLLEAITFRLPIIYADAEVGIIEELKKYDIGISFSPGDAIELYQILKTIRHCEHPINQQRYTNFLSQFTLNRFITSYEHVIEKTAREGASSIVANGKSGEVDN